MAVTVTVTAQGNCFWAMKQLGPVLRTKRNQDGPQRNQETGNMQVRKGLASSQGLPLLSLGVWGEQKVESGQQCLMRTDVLWPECGAWRKGEGREKVKKGRGEGHSQQNRVSMAFLFI